MLGTGFLELDFHILSSPEEEFYSSEDVLLLLSDCDSSQSQFLPKIGETSPSHLSHTQKGLTQIDSREQVEATEDFTPSFGLFQTDPLSISFDLYNNHYCIQHFDFHHTHSLSRHIVCQNVRLCVLNYNSLPQDNLVHGMSITFEICSSLRKTLEIVLASSSCFTILDLKNLEKLSLSDCNLGWVFELEPQSVRDLRKRLSAAPGLHSPKFKLTATAKQMLAFKKVLSSSDNVIYIGEVDLVQVPEYIKERFNFSKLSHKKRTRHCTSSVLSHEPSTALQATSMPPDSYSWLSGLPPWVAHQCLTHHLAATFLPFVVSLGLPAPLKGKPFGIVPSMLFPTTVDELCSHALALPSLTKEQREELSSLPDAALKLQHLLAIFKHWSEVRCLKCGSCLASSASAVDVPPSSPALSYVGGFFGGARSHYHHRYITVPPSERIQARGLQYRKLSLFPQYSHRQAVCAHCRAPVGLSYSANDFTSRPKVFIAINRSCVAHHR